MSVKFVSSLHASNLAKITSFNLHSSKISYCVYEGFKEAFIALFNTILKKENVSPDQIREVGKKYNVIVPLYFSGDTPTDYQLCYTGTCQNRKIMNGADRIQTTESWDECFSREIYEELGLYYETVKSDYTNESTHYVKSRNTSTQVMNYVCELTDTQDEYIEYSPDVSLSDVRSKKIQGIVYCKTDHIDKLMAQRKISGTSADTNTQSKFYIGGSLCIPYDLYLEIFLSSNFVKKQHPVIVSLIGSVNQTVNENLENERKKIVEIEQRKEVVVA